MSEEIKTTTDVPAAEANVGEPKVEWKKEFGRVHLNSIQDIITELNSSLMEGEKPWRLPKFDEIVYWMVNSGSRFLPYDKYPTKYVGNRDEDNDKNEYWYFDGSYEMSAELQFPGEQYQSIKTRKRGREGFNTISPPFLTLVRDAV